MNKLTALIEAAKAATPGPWDSYKSIVVFPQQETGGFSLSNCPRAHANAEFIALANPATILELCALLENTVEAHNKLAKALNSTLEIVATDRCDGDSAFASGVNAACERHAIGIWRLIEGVKK